jgi:hypothetical protein
LTALHPRTAQGKHSRGSAPGDRLRRADSASSSAGDTHVTLSCRRAACVRSDRPRKVPHLPACAGAPSLASWWLFEGPKLSCGARGKNAARVRSLCGPLRVSIDAADAGRSRAHSFRALISPGARARVAVTRRCHRPTACVEVEVTCVCTACRCLEDLTTLARPYHRSAATGLWSVSALLRWCSGVSCASISCGRR